MTLDLHENDDIDVCHLSETYPLSSIKSIEKVSKEPLCSPRPMHGYWKHLKE